MLGQNGASRAALTSWEEPQTFVDEDAADEDEARWEAASGHSARKQAGNARSLTPVRVYVKQRPASAAPADRGGASPTLRLPPASAADASRAKRMIQEIVQVQLAKKSLGASASASCAPSALAAGKPRPRASHKRQTGLPTGAAQEPQAHADAADSPRTSGRKSHSTTPRASVSKGASMTRSQSLSLLERPVTAPLARDEAESASQLGTEGQGWQETSNQLASARQAQAALHSENQALKDEVVSLKKALLDGMRGADRFVSGGQFRSQVVVHRHDSSPKGEAAGARVGWVGANGAGSAGVAKPGSHTEQELLLARRELVILREQLEVAASSRAADEAAKEEAKALRKRLETETRILASARQRADEAQAKLRAAEELAAERLKSLEGLKKELQESKLVSEAAPAPAEQLPKGEAKAALRVRKETGTLGRPGSKRTRLQARGIEERLAAATGELAAARERIVDLQREVDLKDAYVNERNSAKREVQDLEAREVELVDQILAANKEIGALHRQLQEESAVTSALREQLVSLNEKIEEGNHMSFVANLRLGAASRDMVDVKESEMRQRRTIQTLREELAETRLSMRSLAAECEALRDDAGRAPVLERERDALRRVLDEVVSVATPGAPGCVASEGKQVDLSESLLGTIAEAPTLVREALGGSRGLAESLRRRIDELQGEVEAAEASRDLARAQAEALAKETLPALAQSTIRLCVVSPVVNINVRDRRTPAPCAEQSLSTKPTFDRDALRETIQNKVLPRFVQIFEQKQKGISPDKRTPLDKWIPGLVLHLQRAVERHVKKAFSDS